MKTKLQFASLALALILITACTSTVRTLQPGQFVLRPGEGLASEDGSILVTYVRVTEDSRCPMGVQCVWAGQVKVLIEVTQGTEIQQYTLVLGSAFEVDLSSIEVGDYRFTLTQVHPYPQYGQTTNPADYRATLEIQ